MHWITMLLLGGLLLWPRPAAAQAEPITWQIVPGFNGAYRAGAWFPLRVTLSNSGPDLRGTLELRFRESRLATFSQTVELPHNGRKQLVLPVASHPNLVGPVSADLLLRDGSTVVHKERINLQAHDSSLQVVGLISDGGDALPELVDIVPPEAGRAELIRFSSAELSERSEYLQSFDVLFIQGVDTSTWSAAQRAALQSWVGSGGQLVLDGDPLVARGLPELLPATFEEAGDQSSLRKLQNGTGWIAGLNAPVVPVLRLRLRTDADVVLDGNDDLPLLVRRWVGLGQVLMASFRLERLREAGDAARFWPSVLRVNTNPDEGWNMLRWHGREVLEESLRLPGLERPGPLAVLGFMLLYILTIGPLNYLLLRRLGRREWAYLTIPLLVLLFSGGAYAWGTLGRGTALRITELSVVQVQPDATRGQAMSFLTLFSPTRHSYTVDAEPEALVSNLEQRWQSTGGSLDVVFGESSTRVPELLVDIGGVRTLSAEHSVDDVPQVAASRAPGNQITIRNRSDRSFEKLVLVTGAGTVQVIPLLQPGQEQTVVFNSNDMGTNFGMSSDDTIDYDRVFTRLSPILFPIPIGFAPSQDRIAADGLVPFDPEHEVPGALSRVLPDPHQQLYLLGWQPQPVLALTVDGQPTTSTGETIYIWPVVKEQ